MNYKTIVLELIQNRPALHKSLTKNRRLLSTLEEQAQELKRRHHSWKERLSRERPESAPAQISSEALELALAEWRFLFETEIPPDEGGEGGTSTTP